MFACFEAETVASVLICYTVLSARSYNGNKYAFEYNRKYSEQDWNDTASPTSNVYSYRWVIRYAMLSVGVGGVRSSGG